jgi:hypothetical protein
MSKSKVKFILKVPPDIKGIIHYEFVPQEKSHKTLYQHSFRIFIMAHLSRKAKSLSRQVDAA